MKSIRFFKLFAIIFAAPTLALSQEGWQLNSALTAMSGHYDGAQTMNNQDGLGIKVSGEKDKTWGFTASLQSTKIDMNRFMPKPTQNQDNWLLSGFMHTPSHVLPGRWTFQLDSHRVTNDATQNISSDVSVIAPQVTWLSYSQPLKLDLSYANSRYKDTALVRQFSASIAYGFNQAKDWLQVRSYAITNLEPASALGQSSTRAMDVKLTHIMDSRSTFAPQSLTFGIEHGKRIYVVDMPTQTVYNLPMLNEGGESVTGTWKLSSKTDLSLQYSKTRYFSNVPTAPSAHHFTLGTLSAQTATTW